MPPPSQSARARSRRAIIATSFAFLVTMLGTTLPTPLYSIYSEQLAFTPLTVTTLFAVYAIGVVGALALFGRLSDDVGRRPALMGAVALALLSALLFLIPPTLTILLVARIVSGLAAGLMSGAGTAAIMDLFPDNRKSLAGTVAVMVNSGGLAIGTLLSGALASGIALPLVTPFVAHLALCCLALMALVAWTPSPPQRGHLRIRPQRLRVPTEIRGPFLRAVLAAGTGFAGAGVLTAVSALFLARDLQLTSHFLAGFVVFLTFAGITGGQLIARNLEPRTALLAGCAGLVAAAAALAFALASATLAPLLIASVTLGVACGLCMNAGITTTVGKVAPDQRGEVSSSFFSGLYLMLAIPAIGVGLLSTTHGIRPSGLVFSGLVALLALGVGILEALTPRSSTDH